MGYARLGYSPLSFSTPTSSRRLGFDATASGRLAGTTSSRSLAGTNSDIHSLQGTPSLKRKKKQDKEQKEKEQQGKEAAEKRAQIWYGAFDDYNKNALLLPSGKDDSPYLPQPVKMGQGVPETQGDGWSLFGYSESQKTITFTSPAASMFYITGVNDKITAKLPTSPLENGMIKHDHKVVMPKSLTITGWVKRAQSASVDLLLKGYISDKSLRSYFDLKSPWKNYTKMYLSNFSSKVSTQKYDVYDYTLTLTEILIAQNLTDTTSNPGYASESNKGARSAK